jgi:type I restriction enzyme S subunit
VNNHWKQVTLSEICSVSAGNSAPQDPSCFAEGTIPFFRTSDAGKVKFGTIYESQDKLNSHGASKLRRYPSGTILFPKSGASTFLNHRVVLGVEGCVSSHLATIVPDLSLVLPQFLLYALTLIDAKDLIQDQSYPSLNLPAIEKIRIQLPPLVEQQRIVLLLDEAFDGIAIAKANAEKNLQNSKALFESQIEKVLSNGGIGWMSEQLGQVCEIERGGSPRPIQQFLTSDPAGVNWIKIGDATASGKYIYKTEEKIRAEGVKRSRMVYEGDFILSNSMSFGRPYIMKTTGCIHDGWLVLRKPSVNADFLYHALSSKVVFNQFDKLAAGSTVRNLNIGLAKSVWIPIPPLAEQIMLAKQFDELQAETDVLSEVASRKVSKMNELGSAILHEAFSGNRKAA